MKNVKFTLGLMLSLLFAGASVGNAQWSYDTYLSIKASQHYNDEAVRYEEHRIYPDGKNQLLWTAPKDLTNPPGPEWYSGQLLRNYSDIKSIPLYTYDDVRGFIADGSRFYQEIIVKLNYDNGKDVIPFLRRTIATIVDLPDGKKETIIVQDLLLAYSVVNKTQFTYGTGVATYRYRSEALPIMLKYEAAYVDYELWVGEEISNDPGAGNAYPTIPRAVTVFAEDGLTTTPVSGMTQFVDAYKDFTFEVSGDPGKELEITTNNSNYAIGKGITVTPVGDGKWTVKVTRVYTALNIYVAYKSAPESNGGGGDGSNGNLAVQSDAVWASGGTLYVKAAVPGILSVYSVTGQIQETKTVSGSSSLSNLPKGYYIVKLNNKAYKVTIN
jgi:hypothetical protein